jgi:hypothetical protein
VFTSMNRRARRLAAYTVLATLVSLPANAAITWDWSASGESGTFLTNGSAQGDVAAPGTYSFISFTVNSSALGEPLGVPLVANMSPLDKVPIHLIHLFGMVQP